jgi:hypothetical protein
MTADQQFLTRRAEWSTAFRKKLGEKALQGFEHLMSECVTFLSTLLTLTESQAKTRRRSVVFHVSAYVVLVSALPPSSTSNKV